MNSIAFVYFDAGYTLLRPYPSIGYHYAVIAERYGQAVEGERLEGVFRVAWRSARRRYQGNGRLPYGRTESEAMAFWTEVVREGFLAAGYNSPAQPEYYREVFHHFARGECWKIYEDVAEAFALLDVSGIRYGILSNWDARLRLILEDLAPLRGIEPVVLSCDVGAEKPDAAIFEAAARVAGCLPERLALIGDEAEADGLGARAAGWRQCLVWRRDDPLPATASELRAAPTLLEAVRQLLESE